jgi:hypothetical protein
LRGGESGKLNWRYIFDFKVLKSSLLWQMAQDCLQAVCQPIRIHRDLSARLFATRNRVILANVSFRQFAADRVILSVGLWAQLPIDVQSMLPARFRVNLYVTPQGVNLYATRSRVNLYAAPRGVNLYAARSRVNFYAAPQGVNMYATRSRVNLYAPWGVNLYAARSQVNLYAPPRGVTMYAARSQVNLYAPQGVNLYAACSQVNFYALPLGVNMYAARSRVNLYAAPWGVCMLPLGK